MSLNFILLPFTAHTAKEFPPDKKATECFRICPATPQILLGFSMDSINIQKSSFTSWCNSCDWLHRENCVFYVEHSSRAEPNENRQKTLTMECSFLKKGSVAVCLRSLRIRAGEEKNIPRPQGNWWAVNKTQYFIFLLIFKLLIRILYGSP